MLVVVVVSGMVVAAYCQRFFARERAYSWLQVSVGTRQQHAGSNVDATAVTQNKPELKDTPSPLEV